MIDNKDIQRMRDLAEFMKKNDRDSFASFTGGLRDNWIFVMALIAVAVWMVTNINDNKTIDITQQTKIDSNTATIEMLTRNIEDLQDEMRMSFKASDSVNSEILRRLDLVQKDIEIIKAK